jgi:trypsin
VGALAGACAPDAPAGRSSSRSSAIIGGTADTTHDAVMALLQRQTATTAYGCSGTTIAQTGTSAFLLTAAHCVVLHDAMDQIIQPLTLASPSVMTVVPGPDWQTSNTQGHVYTVAAIAIAPGYDGATDSPNDIAIVRYVSGMPSLPTIPILEPADDALSAGSTLTLVGYGVTVVGTQNSVRQTVDRPIGRHDIIRASVRALLRAPDAVSASRCRTSDRPADRTPATTAS